MIKIRPVGFREYQQVAHLLTLSAGEDAVTASPLRPASWAYFHRPLLPILQMSQWVPPDYQSLPAMFTAVSNGKVLGVIALVPDGFKTRRWRIDTLLVDAQESVYDVGTRLIQYAINRYGAEGVHTFLADVSHRHESQLGVFKSCGFRPCTKKHVYLLEKSSAKVSEAVDISHRIKGFRDVGRGDLLRLNQLYRETLPPEVRHSLDKHPLSFDQHWIQRTHRVCMRHFYKRWVVEERARGEVLAYVDLYTENYLDFFGTVVLSPAWGQGATEMIWAVERLAEKTTQSPKIWLTVYEYQSELLEALGAVGASCQHTAEIIVKDYWQPLHQRDVKASGPILLFGGGKTSPASPI